jgi:arylsulfatase A-like enzyme
MGSILKALEENNWLKETLVVFTAYQGTDDPHFNKIVFPKEKWPEVSSIDTNSVIRLKLKTPHLATLLKSATKARNLPGVEEVYYKQELSKRYHYIRTFRSPTLTEKELDWSKNYHGILTQSLASKTSADLLCLLHGGGAQESSQRIPLLIWSPNLHFENEAILNQLQNSRVRLVDVHPMILKLMGLPAEASLDGSSLGIESIAY